MKKLLVIATGFMFLGLVSCGPSAEEKQKMEEQLKVAADSAANALLQQASDAVAAPADSTANDSTAQH